MQMMRVVNGAVRVCLVSVTAFIATDLAVAVELPDTLSRAASAVARPDQAVLLGLAQAGGRLVAVGERGLIAVSDDQAKSWRQVPAAVSVSLTAVSFATPKKGWAVGHRGVILASGDGGNSWTVQLDGRKMAEAALAEAKLAAEPNGHAVANAEALVREGADKPFLDVSFADEKHGLAVGAYGLCARTADGGASWTSCMGQLPNPKGAHLYAIARSGQTLYIAGEQGLLLRSDDAGAHYTNIPGPYTTSLFCVALAGNGDVLLGGLRGTAFVSTNQGRSFEALASDSQGTCSSVARTRDGGLLLVNQLGQLLRYDASSRRLKLLPMPPLAPLSGLLQASSDSLVVVGARGALSIPAQHPTKTP